MPISSPVRARQTGNGTSVYKRLVGDIASLYEGARKALVEAYWEIGKRIVLVEQKGEIKAAHGSGLLQKLSQDLTQKLGPGFSERNLERMRGFYLDHPKSSAPTKLGWAHYVELMSLRDGKKRAHFEEKAVREGLNSHRIRELIRHETVRAEVAQNLAARDTVRETPDVAQHAPARLWRGVRRVEPPNLLTPVRGVLYTYRILKPKLIGEDESELLIDLGFSCTVDLDNFTSKRYEPGAIVISARLTPGVARISTPGVDGVESYKLSITGSGPESLFTYIAEIEKVVDGDTLKVVVDLGFGFETRQYLRLRGLDCPEMDTDEGKKASDFVKARIRTADKIVLTSSKSDKYDRYLADVYFTDPKGQEQYLNNLLLESGLAVKL